MIYFKNVNKSYDGKSLSVKNLNLHIRKGEIFGLIGHNGAGKSTSLKMLTGILSVDQGTVHLDNHDLMKDTLEAKKKLGFVSDEPNAFLKFRGYEFLNFVMDVYEVPQEKREARLSNLLKKFELEEAIYEKIASYSHGMRQKLFLIASLLHEPKVWILDEPMVGLDPQAVYTLKQLMREHADKGNTVLFSSHVLDVVEKLCDRIGIMSKGELLFCGSLEEFKQSTNSNESLETSYLQMVQKNNEEVKG